MALSRLNLARFGNVAGAHGLQGHSGVAPDILADLQWLTDIPPHAGGTSWSAFNAGYRLRDYYVVQHTRADPAASRPGMVVTTAVVAPLDSIVARPLGPLLHLSSVHPALSPIEIPEEPRTVYSRPAAIRTVLDRLATSGRAVWIGQEAFELMVEHLWEVLALPDRACLVFGLIFNPNAVPYLVSGAEDHLQVFSVPLEVRQRFDETTIVDPSLPPTISLIGDSILGIDQRGRDLATKLDIDAPTLAEWPKLVGVAEVIADIGNLSGEQLRGAAQLLANLAPGPEVGESIKKQLAAQFLTTVSTERFEHIRGLRTIPWDAFPQAQPAVVLKKWSIAVMQDDRIGFVDIAEAVTSIVKEKADPWREDLKTALLRAIKEHPLQAVAHMWSAASSDDQLVFDWLTKGLPRNYDVDAELALRAAKGVDKPVWLIKKCREKGWSITHATICDVSDPLVAWQEQISLHSQERNAFNILTERVGEALTIKAATRLLDDDLVAWAGTKVAEDPTLLRPADVEDAGWRSVWTASVRSGADPWTVVDPKEATPVLISQLIKGDAVDPLLLREAADTPAADLSAHPNRAEAWNDLQGSVRKKFLDRTARSVSQAMDPSDPGDSLEPPLVAAILRPDNIRAMAILDPSHAIGVVTALAEDADDSSVITIVDAVSLSVDEARQIGRLVAKQKWHSAARDLANKAKNRADLAPAANACDNLLSTLERLSLWFVVGKSGATEPDLRDGLLEVAVRLYSSGPLERNIWERAGGDEADLVDKSTGRERWRVAIRAAMSGERGAPPLCELLDAMLEDYPKQQDLQTIRGLV